MFRAGETRDQKEMESASRDRKSTSRNDEAGLKLKVTEALSKDMGRAYARMDPGDLEKLQAGIGDIVEIQGKRKTVCKVMPAYKELRGQSRVQLDGLTRENAGASLDEFVAVRKTACRPAERIVLAPANIIPGDRDLEYIGSLLDGLPVQKGDRIRAMLFGSRSADFQVENTVPGGPVLINPTTGLVVGKQRQEQTPSLISYEDVGGLKSQLQRIREMIELPLRSKYVGESERGVREIFRKAKQAAPCIIFFDEIDALVPVRSGGSSDSHVSERVLSQFLSELDGIEELKGVLVLGATNRLDMLDPAVLRPGRFDEIVEIPLPDEADRREIFRVHLRNRPQAPEVSPEALACGSEELSGAEIASVCNKAALSAIQRAIQTGKESTDDKLTVLIEKKDLENALAEVREIAS